MRNKHNSAIALILSVGILAILALITVGFSAFTRLELQATENQINLLKASFIAQAGIAQAVADIKYDPNYGAMNEPYDSSADPWYYQGDINYNGSTVDLATATNPSYGGDINYVQGSYRLKVIDCGGLININCPLPDTDAEDDLVDILYQLGLTKPQAQNLVSFRQTLPGGVFTSKEEIKLVPVIPRITQATYESIKDFITLWGDEDDGIIDLDKSAGSAISPHTRKSFVNVNTAPVEVLRAVFRPMMDQNDNTSNTQADNLAAAIKARRATNPFDGLDITASVFNFLSARGEFERFIEYAHSTGIVSETNRDAVLAQSDPNHYSPDNTDSTNSAIIGFDANGFYEIEAIGTYRGAKKRIKQVVSVFRKINQTTKDEFSAKAELSATCRISWKDTCPVDFTLLKQFHYQDDSEETPNLDDYIKNSLKLGFWDNFQEDYGVGNRNPNASGDLGPWKAIEETFTINASEDGLLRTWPPGGPTGASPGIDYFPLINLDADVCIVDDFALIAHGVDETSKSKFAIRDNLPWPAIPREWTVFAPVPSLTNCPDAVGNPTLLANLVLWFNNNPDRPGYNPSIPYIPYRQHQQYLNTLQIQFGGYRPGIANEEMSAIFCNNIQDKSLIGSYDAYQQWINYDGSGYIYFSPSPPLTTPGFTWLWTQTTTKPKDVLNSANVMVTCNTWEWGGTPPHPADNGTEYFPTGGAYQAEKTFHVKAFGNKFDPKNEFRGEVYFSGNIKQFNTTEVIMVGDDRYFKISGLGNLPDLDYFRVVPGQGVYTSKIFSPAVSMGVGKFLEWGTISAHVTLPVTADPAIDDADAGREPVYLAAFGSAVVLAPDPADIPSPIILASGGAIGINSSQDICYQAFLFSDFGEVDISKIDFEQAPVVEDVTITYLPKTQIVYYNAI